jgi:hypothetical protein
MKIPEVIGGILTCRNGRIRIKDEGIIVQEGGGWKLFRMHRETNKIVLCTETMTVRTGIAFSRLATVVLLTLLPIERYAIVLRRASIETEPSA